MFDMHGLSGSTPLYVTGEEAIRLTAWNAASGVTLALTGRFLPVSDPRDTSPQRVTVFEFDLTPTTDRVASLATNALGDGWLLDWSVRATAGTPKIGQCFAAVSLVRGRSGSVQDLSTLATSYVTANQRLAWPGTPLRSSLEGRGTIRSFTGTNPAAATEFSETVPTGARWRILAVSVVLVTDANVANRLPVLIIDDGATRVLGVSTGSVMVASTTYTATWAAIGAAQQPGSSSYATMLPPDLSLPAGFRLRSATTLMQAGDDYGAPQLLVEEWMDL